MPLTRRQLAQLSAAIRERRDALSRELAEEADRTDPVEAADTERDLAELQELEAAALRLDKGTYGVCADCGAEIEAERLFARPGVTRCIACQRRHEKTYKGAERSSL